MRKVCIVVASRANYGRIKSVLRSVQAHPGLHLQIVVAASALLYRFGSVVDVLRAEGFVPNATCHTVIEGNSPVTMAKSTGLGIIELATLFESLSPDIVLTVADRYETLATAVAASYMNIPLAHTQGGEVTGSIDESVRHAITKLAHIHFPASPLAAQNIINMGEDPSKVFLTGCPAMDLLTDIDFRATDDLFHRAGGVGPSIDSSKPYLVVLQHPVTTEYGQAADQILATLTAITDLGMQTAWLWPNVDAGSDDISKQLRIFRENHSSFPIHFFKNFTPEDYARLIANCACLVGNSSSALREGSFLGVPAVNIGNRQNRRECSTNVIHTPYSAQAIKTAIQTQLEHGKYAPSYLFGDGKAGIAIADILASADLDIMKSLTY